MFLLTLIAKTGYQINRRGHKIGQVHPIIHLYVTIHTQCMIIIKV